MSNNDGITSQAQ